MRRRIVAAAFLIAALAAAGCRYDDVYVPRSRTPGVADGPSAAPPGPAGAEVDPAPR